MQPKIPAVRRVIEMKEKQRNHLISEKVPLIAIVFWIILAFVLEIILDGLFKAFFPSDGTGMIGNISSICMAILLIAVLMFIVGRGHTVYIDNKTLEFNGQTAEAYQRVEVWVGGERLSKLGKRERTMSTVIGSNFEMKLINTVNKGDEPTEEIVKISLPYGWDGIVVNVPGYLAGLPQEAWMTEFISEPEPVTAEDEEITTEDEIPMGDF